MFERFRKKPDSSPIVLFEYKDLLLIRNLLNDYSAVSNVSINDENTIEVVLKQEKKLKCMLKIFEGGKGVFVAYWDLNKKNTLAYTIGSRLWNDRKEISHLTYSYITQNNVCVFESHINLDWGVSELYFGNWCTSYLDHLPDFASHITKVSEGLKNLPKSKLTMLEKLEFVGEVGDIIGTIARLFDQ
jgi:hypothetical protein